MKDGLTEENLFYLTLFTLSIFTFVLMLAYCICRLVRHYQ